VETEERRRQTKSGFATRKACQAAMAKLLVAVEEHSNVSPTRLIMRDYLLKYWLPAIEGTIRPTTFAGYRTACQQHIIPQLGSCQLQRLTGATLNGLYATLGKEGRVRGKGGLSPASVRQVHATLHRALRDAVRWGYLHHNAAESADPPRASAQHAELPAWNEEQLHAFLDSVRDDRLYPMWRVLAMSGCRRGEVLGLRWEDVDMEHGRVTIRRALVPVNGEVHVSEPKTKRGRRLIAFDSTTMALLKEQAAQQIREQETWGEGWLDSGYVFTLESGAHLHPERISALFQRLVRSAALKPIPLHGLRHTYATLALSKGVNPAIVSLHLGHSSVAFTLDVYSHVLPQVDAEAAELIASYDAA
jgi:integrase